MWAECAPRRESSRSLRAPRCLISVWHLKEWLFSALPKRSELNKMPQILEALKLDIEIVSTN